MRRRRGSALFPSEERARALREACSARGDGRDGGCAPCSLPHAVGRAVCALATGSQEGRDHLARAEPSAVALATRRGVLPVAGEGGLRVGRVIITRKGEARGRPRCRQALHLDCVGQRGAAGA
eukprot:3928315-Pleurochrysis_carterae.AAC.1